MMKGFLSASLIVALAIPLSSNVFAITEAELEEELKQYEKRLKKATKAVKRNKKAARKGARALDTFKKRFSVNGFMSAGVVTLDDDSVTSDWVGTSSTITDETNYQADSFLGLQFDYQMSEKFSVTTQYISTMGLEPVLDGEWAYLSYKWSDEFKLRAGRMRTPFFALSEFLDVGYAYPWVRPSEDVYAIPFSSYEGFDLTHTVDVYGVTVTMNGFWGRGTANIAPGADLAVKDFIGFNFVVNKGPVTLRFSNTRAQSELELEAGSTFDGVQQGLIALGAPELVGENSEPQFRQVGYVYDDGRFVSQGEWVELKWDNQILANFQASYMSFGMRLDKWMPYVSYGRSYTTDNGVRDAIADTLNGTAASLTGLVNGSEVTVGTTTVDVPGLVDFSAWLRMAADLADTEAGEYGNIDLSPLNDIVTTQVIAGVDQATAAATATAIANLVQSTAAQGAVPNNENAYEASRDATYAAALAFVTGTIDGFFSQDSFAEGDLAAVAAGFSGIGGQSPDGADLRLMANQMSGTDGTGGAAAALLSTANDATGAVPTLLNFSNQQKSITAGVRYELNNRVTTKLQVQRAYDFGDTTGRFGVADGVEMPDKVYVYSFVVDAVF